MPITYEPIATFQVNTSAVTNIDFTSIPQTYTDLRVIGVSGQQTAGSIGIKLNDNLGPSYSITRLRGNGTTAETSRSINQGQWRTFITSANNTINVFSDVNIFNYTNTSPSKLHFLTNIKVLT
jgi:hypothetical protein